MTFIVFTFQFLIVKRNGNSNCHSSILAYKKTSMYVLYCSFSKLYYNCTCIALYTFKMAALADHVSVEAVRELVQNHTLDEVSDILQTEFPNQRSFSVKSIKRFCQAHGIAKRKLVTDDELDRIVESSVRQVNVCTILIFVVVVFFIFWYASKAIACKGITVKYGCQ